MNKEKRKEFLNSKEGADRFRNQTQDISRQKRSRLKNKILFPKLTKAEIERMEWNEKIDQAISSEKED